MDFVSSFSSPDISNVQNFTNNMQKQDLTLMSNEKLTWENDVQFSAPPTSSNSVFQGFSPPSHKQHPVEAPGVVQV